MGAQDAEYSDVLIVGAGISGIGAAYRIHDKNPGLSYTVLERRERISPESTQRSFLDCLHTKRIFYPWRGLKTSAFGGCRKTFLLCVQLKPGR